VALPAYCQPTFTELLDEAKTQYREGNYLSAKSLMMKATANLNKTVADQLEKGEIPFLLFREELSQLMDAQFKEWRTDFLGKEVIWQGWIENVEKEWYGSYTVRLEMDKPEVGVNEYDVSLVLSSNQKELALSLEKGAEVKFKGNISDISRSSGRIVVIVKNVKLM
jgi:UPF0288 family protein (methanogenesis marker protein 3)